MKQSNLVLGIGILVAIILIISSLFLSTGSSLEAKASSQVKSTPPVAMSIKNFALIRFQVILSQFSKIP